MKLNKKQFTKFIFIAIIAAVVLIGYFIIDNQVTKYKQSKADEPIEMEAIKLVDATCENCFDMSLLIEALQNENVIFNKIREVDINSEEGQQLIEQNKIVKVPITIIKGDYQDKPEFIETWNKYGIEQSDQLISDVYPPYKTIGTDEITGLVNMTIVYDEDCKECYNTKVHDALLEAEGIIPVSTVKYNINETEAKDLIEKYSITKVPTIILSSEAEAYKSFNEHWPGDGIVAEDGNYVFTAVEELGTYKDLETNEIIESKQE